MLQQWHPPSSWSSCPRGFEVLHSDELELHKYMPRQVVVVVVVAAAAAAAVAFSSSTSSRASAVWSNNGILNMGPTTYMGGSDV